MSPRRAKALIKHAKPAKFGWRDKTVFDYIYHELKNENGLGLRKKKDWSITAKLSCTCSDCETLSKFLQADTIQYLCWPMGKDRRAHIHQKIDGLGVPVTHQTEHIGSPHKLILTKTDKLFSQAKERFDRIEKNIILSH